MLDSPVGTKGAPSIGMPPLGARTLFGHPFGLTVLFLTGMWEVFAIFGMRTALIYYLVKQLDFTQKHAVEVYSLSAAACVLMGVVGSLSADRFLGPRKAVILGALLMATASFSLISGKLLYANLALMAIGNGFFKSTMVAQVGALYLSEDVRRDRAFVIYKVGCNIGAFIAPLVCGTIGAIYGWNWAFAASGIGMLISIAVFVSGRAHLAAVRPRERSLVELGGSEPPKGLRLHSGSLLLLVWVGSVLFWVAYRQVESTVALWADRSVDRSIAIGAWRFVVPAAWFQSLNPLLIFAFAPVVTWIWARREHRASVDHDLGKMVLGCVQLAGAFGVMGVAALVSRGAGVNGGWVIVAIALLTLGELYVDPIGQALFNRLAVNGLFSVYVSFWFLASLVAYFVSAWLASAWALLEPGLFFSGMAATALAGGVLIFVARCRHRRAAPQAAVIFR